MTRGLVTQAAKGSRSWPYSVLVAEEGKNKELYYRPTRGGRFSPKEIPQDELFTISDVLLDLDDERNKDVRPLGKDDESQMKEKWAIDAGRQRARDQVDELKKQVEWSRRQVSKMATRPAHVWPVSSHDVLSVALRGAPLPKASHQNMDIMHEYIDKAEQDVEVQNEAGSSSDIIEGDTKEIVREIVPDSMSYDALDPRKQPDLLNSVLSENGIGTQALADDNLLLHWLRLRQKGFEDLLAQSQLRKPISSSDFTMVLRQQRSIAGIRRLISRSLSSGLEASAFHTSSYQDECSGTAAVDLSLEVRNACAKVLSENNADVQPVVETLVMLGNLKTRLHASKARYGPPLWGLGLSLSARIGNLKSTFENLHQGFMGGAWAQHPALVDDMECSLKSFLHHLSYPSIDKPLEAQARQELLQLLVGIGENNQLRAQSYRSYVLNVLDNGPDHQVPQACRAYESYIKLLGRLGAVRTLWKEWNSTAYNVQQRVNNSEHKGQSEYNVVEAFLPAYTASLMVVAPQIQDRDKDVTSLAECAVLDYRSIERQDPNCWFMHWQQGPHVPDQPDYGDVGERLGRPLAGWLQAVEARSRKTRVMNRLLSRTSSS